MSGRWLHELRAAAGPASCRMLVAHHSGGASTAYLPLARLLPDDVEVVGVVLPGRERRFSEGLRPLSPSGAVREVLEEAVQLPRLPTVLFGHSLGAALVIGLLVEGPPGLAAAAVLSSPPPVPSPQVSTEWTEEAVLEVVRRGGATPAEVLEDPWFREHLIELMRHDLSLSQGLAAVYGEAPLSLTPHLLAGKDDDLLPLGHLRARTWRTPATPQLQVLPGGHFFLLEESNLEQVAAALAAAIRSTSPT